MLIGSATHCGRPADADVASLRGNEGKGRNAAAAAAAAEFVKSQISSETRQQDGNFFAGFNRLKMFSVGGAGLQEASWRLAGTEEEEPPPLPPPAF